MKTGWREGEEREIREQRIHHRGTEGTEKRNLTIRLCDLCVSVVKLLTLRPAAQSSSSSGATLAAAGM